LPVSVKEYLTLLEALQKGVVGPKTPQADDDSEPTGYKIDDFYYLSRTSLVKDEKHYDKFDRAFAAYFKGVEMLADFTKEIPAEWLRKSLELNLSPEELAKIEKMGWDELMETLKKRLEEQKERHEGGNKWIGTGGTSPFGAYGKNPQGIRIGQDKGRNRSAVKVWDQRAYKATMTTRRSWARATSRWRCAACASSPAKATRMSWIWTRPSARRRPMRATWTSRCGPSATTMSRCCC
jgi:uncharacterized protein with von Willebrand factor type A (vWA) domain